MFNGNDVLLYFVHDNNIVKLNDIYETMVFVLLKDETYQAWPTMSKITDM